MHLNKKKFKLNKEVISALKQYFIMPKASLVNHSTAPVSEHLKLLSLTPCIILPTHMDVVPYPDIFIQNVQSWPHVCWAYKHVRPISALNMLCYHILTNYPQDEKKFLR